MKLSALHDIVCAGTYLLHQQGTVCYFWVVACATAAGLPACHSRSPSAEKMGRCFAAAAAAALM